MRNSRLSALVHGALQHNRTLDPPTLWNVWRYGEEVDKLYCIFWINWTYLKTYFNLCYPESCLHARMMCILLVMAFGGRERRGFWRWSVMRSESRRIKPYTVIIKQIRSHRTYGWFSVTIHRFYLWRILFVLFFVDSMLIFNYLGLWQEVFPLSPWSPGHTWAGWWTRMAPRFVVTRAMLQTCRSLTGICQWGTSMVSMYA